MRVLLAGIPALCLVMCACSASPSDDTTGGDDNTGGTRDSGTGGGARETGGAGATGGTSGKSGTPDAGKGGAAGHTDGGGASGAGGASGRAGGAPDAGASTGGSSGTGGTTQSIGACNDLGPAGQWQDIKPPEVETTQAIILDPFHIGTIWLGTTGHGIMKSTNCGSTWTHVSTGQNGTEVDRAALWSFVVDPAQEGVMYAIGAYGPQGLYKSTNGGVDWVQLFEADSEFAKTVPYNFVGSVSIDPHDHMHLVVGTHSNCLGAYAPACMAETKDGGETWTLARTPFMSGWEEQAGPYALDPTSTLYATLNEGMWLTRDNGATWKNVTPSGVKGATGGEYTVDSIQAGPDGTLYLPSISRGGLMTSTDHGSTWMLAQQSPQGSFELGIAVGGGHVYLGDHWGRSIAVAALTDLTKWSTLPALPNPNTPPYLRYDETHHVLYSAGAGLVRLVTE